MPKPILFAAASLAAAGAIAGPAYGQDSECVSLRNINGYSVIDDRHVVLNSGASRHYLITTRTRCSGLSFGAQIATSFGDNARICPPVAEYIIPSDGWRCAIDTIEEVESQEQAEALVAERAGAEG